MKIFLLFMLLPLIAGCSDTDDEKTESFTTFIDQIEDDTFLVNCTPQIYDDDREVLIPCLVSLAEDAVVEDDDGQEISPDHLEAHQEVKLWLDPAVNITDDNLSITVSKVVIESELPIKDE
ncbi:hypothetical protein LF817_19350 [Halobacillus sp. A1]|uniref:hypothetical protein n=1 Tax=Halobacillus sp. A1 TaxID=2880262 RepID=UPI0020A679EA|nr:hypothetical protein [Halobacillus sp. A1]MCP3033484.1 hypothetical protein [Halobacillus sp. A1]